MAEDNAHPTWDEIDAVRAGEGLPEHPGHIESCTTCQATLATLERLAAGLSFTSRTPFEIPGEVDARILWNSRTRARAARQEAGPMRRRLIGSRWAIAAALVLTVGAVGLWQRARLAPVQVASFATDDIDRNNKIDIRDAFLLAKAIENKSDADLAREIEGDDFDAGDIDRIARQAVAIGRTK